MSSLFDEVPIGESTTPLSRLWRDLDPHIARRAGIWAYHGPAESPYFTDEDAERAEADLVWAMLRENNN